MHLRFFLAIAFLRSFLKALLSYSFCCIFLPLFTKQRVVQVNSVQNHLNCSESKCFLCQDTIKHCNTFNLFFPWRGMQGGCWRTHPWSTLSHSVVCSTKYCQHPQPLLGPWVVGPPTQHLTWATDPFGLTCPKVLSQHFVVLFKQHQPEGNQTLRRTHTKRAEQGQVTNTRSTD